MNPPTLSLTRAFDLIAETISAHPGKYKWLTYLVAHFPVIEVVHWQRTGKW